MSDTVATAAYARRWNALLADYTASTRQWRAWNELENIGFSAAVSRRALIIAREWFVRFHSSGPKSAIAREQV
jgi:hypothetical protein